LVIPGDVNPETGNINFNGDVHIKGSVMDNLKVIADGDIIVSGNVLQANLIAKGSIDIAGNIISSKITAGTAVINNLCILPIIKQVLDIVNNDFFDANSEVWLSGYRKMMERHPVMYSESASVLKAGKGYEMHGEAFAGRGLCFNQGYSGRDKHYLCRR
jgi:cytoskeletal protein CcmA (bactofilin family)